MSSRAERLCDGFLQEDAHGYQGGLLHTSQMEPQTLYAAGSVVVRSVRVDGFEQIRIWQRLTATQISVRAVYVVLLVSDGRSLATEQNLVGGDRLGRRRRRVSTSRDDWDLGDEALA